MMRIVSDRRRLVRSTGVILLAGAISGCTATEDNRWGTVTGLSGKPIIPDFMVSSTAVSSDGDLSFADLPDPVAAAYIGAVAKVSTTPAQLLSLLRTPIRPAGVSDDTTTFRRMLVFNVFEKGFSPGDNLVQTRLTLTPQNFSFEDLEAAKTEYSTIEVDKIDTTNGISATAGLQASPPIPIGTASASITGSHTTERSTEVNVRVQDLSVNLENGALTVFREGGRGRDLTGNTIIKLTVRDASPAEAGRRRTRMMAVGLDVGAPGGWKRPTQAHIELERRVGLYATGMLAEARLNYVLRHVEAGAKTYEEGDDAVRFVTGCVAKEVVVVPASETVLHTWVVQARSGAVLIDTDAGPEDLTFGDYATARKFVSWLQATGASAVGALRLRVFPDGDTLDGTVPLGRDRSNLRVVSTMGQMTRGEVTDSRPHPCPSNGG